MTASGYLAFTLIDLQSLWLWPHLTPSKFKLIQKVASSLQDSIIPLYLRRQQLHCATVRRRSVASKPATFMSVASLNDLKSKILGGVCCLVSKAQSWDTLSSCLCAFNSTQTQHTDCHKQTTGRSNVFWSKNGGLISFNLKFLDQWNWNILISV